MKDIDQKIEAARLKYWSLIKQKAEGLGITKSEVLTGQAQFVDEKGNVYMGAKPGQMANHNSKLVGKTAPPRAGWCAWGLEAAGPPFSAPPWPESRG